MADVRADAPLMQPVFGDVVVSHPLRKMGEHLVPLDRGAAAAEAVRRKHAHYDTSRAVRRCI